MTYTLLVGTWAEGSSRLPVEIRGRRQETQIKFGLRDDQLCAAVFYNRNPRSTVGRPMSWRNVFPKILLIQARAALWSVNSFLLGPVNTGSVKQLSQRSRSFLESIALQHPYHWFSKDMCTMDPRIGGLLRVNNCDDAVLIVQHTYCTIVIACCYYFSQTRYQSKKPVDVVFLSSKPGYLRALHTKNPGALEVGLTKKRVSWINHCWRKRSTWHYLNFFAVHYLSLQMPNTFEWRTKFSYNIFKPYWYTKRNLTSFMPGFDCSFVRRKR